MDKNKITVTLDPGHGLQPDGSYQRPLMDCRSKNPFAVSDSMFPHPDDYTKGFYREDFGTLKIAQVAAEILRKEGHIVHLTRADERNAKLYLSEQSDNAWKRTYWKKWKWIKDFTIKNKTDIFVSIHTNAGKGTGSRCFWASSPNGILLSQHLVQGLYNKANINKGRIAKHRYLILRDICEGRAVLLECLFHDSFKDIKLLLSEKGTRKVGKGIAHGLLNYIKTLN